MNEKRLGFSQRHPMAAGLLLALGIFLLVLAVLAGGFWAFITGVSRSPGEDPLQDTVRISSYPAGQTLELSIPSRWSGDGSSSIYDAVSFSPQPAMTFAEITAAAQDALGAEQVERHGSSLLLRQADGEGAYSYYMVTRTGENSYLLHALRASLCVLEGSVQKNYGILLPFQYVSDSRIIEETAPCLYAGAEYQLALTWSGGAQELEAALNQARELFLDFYDDTACQAELQGDAILLQDGRQDLSITFTGHSGQLFFTVTLAETGA